jgi:hypothetical protein
MSTDPQHFWPDVTTESGKQFALKILQTTVQEHEQAFTELKTQLDAAVAAQTTVTNTTTTTTTGTTTTYGLINNQTGTSYTVQDSDYGGLITLDNAAAVAVTLNTSVRQYWFAAFHNLGAGTVTITPASGNINLGGSITLITNASATIFFDGVNWWATTTPIFPQTIAAVAHQFLTSYTASTGVFTLAQPTVADVTGAAPSASPTFSGTVTQPTPSVLTGATTATSATTGAATALPALPAGYLTVSINGTSFKIPYYAV